MLVCSRILWSRLSVVVVMKRVLLTGVAALAAFAAPVSLAARYAPPPARVDVQVIGFTDGQSQWHFTPTVIRASYGDTIHVRFSAEGAGHGFKLVRKPEVDLTAYPGMPAETSFVADWVGGREFYCTFDCGPGHAQMSGMIVVRR